MSYAVANFLTRVLEMGGIKWLLIVFVLLSIGGIFFWIGKVLVKYITHRMMAEDIMRDELLKQLRTQHAQAADREERVEAAFIKQTEDDHRFQAKTVEALHGIKDLCQRVEKQNGEDHSDFLEKEQALITNVAVISSWVHRHG